MSLRSDKRQKTASASADDAMVVEAVPGRVLRRSGRHRSQTADPPDTPSQPKVKGATRKAAKPSSQTKANSSADEPSKTPRRSSRDRRPPAKNK